ncbi:MAG TPA: hypothetical protein VGG66_03140 [Rhizomicrobium sp.]|jgi:hypothetical protein
MTTKSEFDFRPLDPLARQILNSAKMAHILGVGAVRDSLIAEHSPTEILHACAELGERSMLQNEFLRRLNDLVERHASRHVEGAAGDVVKQLAEEGDCEAAALVPFLDEESVQPLDMAYIIEIAQMVLSEARPG